MQMQESAARVWTVGQLCRALRAAVRDAFPFPVRVRGEVSECRLHTSGHAYFTLKDGEGLIRCACFRSTVERLHITFPIEDGTAVEVLGRVSIYEKASAYELIVDDVVPVGRGALYRQFELLKEKLAKEGLFDESRKRPIPSFVRAVAVVTSRDGAVLHDFFTTIRSSGAVIRVTPIDAPVQGAAAAGGLVAAIRRAGALPVDVVIVARGGGSIEDLWAFNTEIVARAIANCDRPVISAVGHETDVTIADFVADLRAATPTAAAMIVAQQQMALVTRLQHAEAWLRRALLASAVTAAARLKSALRDLWRAPDTFVAGASQHVDHLAAGLDRSNPRRRLTDLMRREHIAHLRLAAVTGRLIAGAKDMLAAAQAQVRRVLLQSLSTQAGAVGLAAAKLGALAPQSTLDRGYAIVFDAKRQVITNSAQASIGDDIDVVLSRGAFAATVKNVARRAQLGEIT